MKAIIISQIMQDKSTNTHNNVIRDAPILPANFLEKYVGKSKEQNAGKIGGKLEKLAPRNGSLAHFV